MKHSIQVSRTAHYHLQIPNGEVKSILFVLHGYAQLAEEFLSDFVSLKNSSVLVVAPEALSKFYNKERKAVANWMTSHERNDEIVDYINFLNQVRVRIQKDYQDVPISVLGFSQGVSTAMRWLAQSETPIKEIHLCSGTIPPELTKTDLLPLKETHFFYYFGTQDRLLKPEEATKQINFLKELTPKVESIQFEGRHEISKETIDNLLKLSSIY